MKPEEREVVTGEDICVRGIRRYLENEGWGIDKKRGRPIYTHPAYPGVRIARRRKEISAKDRIKEIEKISAKTGLDRNQVYKQVAEHSIWPLWATRCFLLGIKNTGNIFFRRVEEAIGPTNFKFGRSSDK